MDLIEVMKQALEALESTQPENPHSIESKAITSLRQTIAEAEKQEIEPRFGQGISDNPYCNDADSNEPDSKAMRWHNKLLSLEAEAKLKEKNT